MEKDSDSKSYNIFGPVGNGFWYPDNRVELTQFIFKFFSKAVIKKPGGKIAALIAPHAGYSIAGQAAAYSFKSLTGEEIEKVFILAPSHRKDFHGLATLSADYFQTTLGRIKIDVEIIEKLNKNDLISSDRTAFIKEHAVDNMLPFLQYVLKDFQIVPVLTGWLDKVDYPVLAGEINKFVDQKTLIVVSSDFTHYGFHYGYFPFPHNKNTRDNIEKLDKGLIANIINPDFENYMKYLEETGITACGHVPIGLLINILKPGTKGELLNYYMSGDLYNDYSSCVSYASIVFTETHNF